MTFIEDDARRWDAILKAIEPYSKERREDIGRKHSERVARYDDWKDLAADESGVKRFGEI